MRSVLNLLLFTLLTVPVFASVSREELARQAVSAEPGISNAAIAELRAIGPDGLDTLFSVYGTDIKRFTETGNRAENWERIAHAIDTVAMQKDAFASHLYWYTDLEQAKKVADSQNKPLLSLRLLGNLNEEFSCANSRFFRALLYSNSEISRYLRENYVLHWRSVRPAPKVTIDFGDGRRIERTLTGNSIHYILSEEGEVIDALPGLYSPKAFLIYITQARNVNRVLRDIPAAQRMTALLRYRKTSFDRIRERRQKNITAANVRLTEPQVSGLKALDVAPLAMVKMITETTILTSILDDFSRYEPSVRLDDWEKLARHYSPNNEIDVASTAFIRRQNPDLSQPEFDALIARLNKYLSQDTTRNDFLLHPQLYSWLNRGNPTDLEAFNTRVYSEIFKTPDSDRWLGLYPTDVYTALDGNGVIK